MNRRQSRAALSHRQVKTTPDSAEKEPPIDPELARAYIEVTQKLYDRQVKTGELPPEEAEKAGVVLKQFHREMKTIIVRDALVETGKRLLKMKVKRRLNAKDADFLQKCLEEGLAAMERHLADVAEEDRAELDEFLKNVEIEAMLLGERLMVEQCGKEAAKEIMAESGMELLSEIRKGVKRGAGPKRRPPASRRSPRSNSKRRG